MSIGFDRLRLLRLGDLVITLWGTYVVVVGEELEHVIGWGIYFATPKSAQRFTAASISVASGGCSDESVRPPRW